MIVVCRRPVQGKLRLVIMEAEDLIILKKGKIFYLHANFQIRSMDGYIYIFFFHNHFACNLFVVKFKRNYFSQLLMI